MRERLAKPPRKATKKEQAELDAKLGITNGEWEVPDTIQLTGKSPQGFTMSMTIALDGSDMKDPDFIENAEKMFIALGAVVPAPATRAQAPAPAQQQYNNGGGAPQRQGGGGCYIHGFDFDRPGYLGRGRECGASSDTPQEWTKRKQASNGKFYCASKW